MDKKGSSVGLITTIKLGKEKTISYVTVGFTMLVVVLLVVFAIRPTVTTIVKINKEVKEKENISSLLKRRIQTISTLNDEYEESKEKFEMLSLVFPVSERYVLFLSNIEPVISRNGFKLNSVSFDRYEGETYNLSPSVLKPTTAKVSISGEYNNFINLLKDLESLPIHTVVESVSFSNVHSETDSLSFFLSLRIYNISEDNFYTLK